jgi:cell division protein FtsL
MKWKDSGEDIEKEEKSKEEYFDEEQYSPWSERTQKLKIGMLSKTHLMYILAGLVLFALISVLTILLSGGNGAISAQGNPADLEKRIRELEQRLDNYQTIDEKVTRIWEQAKSFEKFKDRFDRSEASTSLRMDHLTMSLESMQKQVNEVLKTKPAPLPPQPSAGKSGSSQANSRIKYHKVSAGDTFYSISKQYGLELEELLKINRMKPDSVIVPGQQLIVSGP